MNLFLAHISERDSQRIENTLFILGLSFVVVVAVVIFCIVNWMQLTKARSEHRKKDASESSEDSVDHDQSD